MEEFEGNENFDDISISEELDDINDNVDGDIQELNDIDVELFTEQYNEFQEAQESQEQFDSLTDGLSIEQLNDLKSRVLNGDKAVLKEFGLDDEIEDGGFQKTLKRR